MFKFFAAATIMAISLTSHAELLENGDFESAWDPETERGPGYIYNPDKTNSGLGWTFVGDSGLSKSGTAWHGVSPDNSQFAFIQRDYSSIQQTFSVAGWCFGTEFLVGLQAKVQLRSKFAGLVNRW